MERLSGFTLIELLIVVAIIAILAAIAVPNFLEAQTRAKVSRVKSDLRTMGTAIESYRVDNNKVPCDYDLDAGDPFHQGWEVDDVSGILHPGCKLPDGRVRAGLTTPISYISNCWVEDPFVGRNRGNIRPDTQVYTYNILAPVWGKNVSSYLGGNGGSYFRAYGDYRLFSIGPDRMWSNIPTDSANGYISVTGGRHAIPYDASNGTTSLGNIIRTQKLTEVNFGPPPA